MAHPLPVRVPVALPVNMLTSFQATLKRINKEIADVKKEDLGNITLVPSDNLFVWEGTLPGPEGSVYEGGVFNIAINLPPDYPYAYFVFWCLLRGLFTILTSSAFLRLKLLSRHGQSTYDLSTRL
jgi:hypothetical protein